MLDCVSGFQSGLPRRTVPTRFTPPSLSLPARAPVCLPVAFRLPAEPTETVSVLSADLDFFSPNADFLMLAVRGMLEVRGMLMFRIDALCARACSAPELAALPRLTSLRTPALLAAMPPSIVGEGVSADRDALESPLLLRAAAVPPVTAGEGVSADRDALASPLLRELAVFLATVGDADGLRGGRTSPLLFRAAAVRPVIVGEGVSVDLDLTTRCDCLRDALALSSTALSEVARRSSFFAGLVFLVFLASRKGCGRAVSAPDFLVWPTPGTERARVCIVIALKTHP